MAGMGDRALREQLVERRSRLRAALPAEDDSEVIRLLNEVDAALERMDRGTYGICETCHEPVEADRLLMDPLTRFCLDHLNPEQQRALEHDLELAASIQRGLLPRPELSFAGWQVHHHYQPLGPVSGDYCDAVTIEDAEAKAASPPLDGGGSSLLLLLGDVSGKGVAASMLMAHLNALFRSLSGFRMPLEQMMERANRVFCESTLASHFATLVAIRAQSSGEIEVCNAGHSPVVLVCGGEVSLLEPDDLPLGMFVTARFSSRKGRLGAGDSILAYTDGLSEAQGAGGAEYGEARLKAFARHHHTLPAGGLLRAWLQDVDQFRAGVPLSDDLSAMVVRRL